ncbi:MAG TPA: hypothetical protein VGR87_05055 [Candidatus Limnocylindria bacterium]|jgi:hypothetical protein|nr:hypothetical protein [Candidatus Limnocylindria bacterium]
MSGPHEDARKLVTWSLSTFHASAFVLAIVLLLYSRGGLGPALGGLNTLFGLGLFVALWVTTYVTTSRALEGIDLLDPAVDRVRFLRRALRWGAANALAFLAVLGILFVAGAILTAPAGLMSLVFIGPFAVVIGAAVGAVVGTFFGLVDLALCALARAALVSET